MTNSLKAEVRNHHAAFVALNLAVFFVVTLTSNEFRGVDGLMEVWEGWRGTFALVVPFISFILSGLVPPDAKAVLVFWKRKNPLPGSRAFTEIARKDPRFTIEQLVRYGSFPEDGAEQNRLWYEIYQSVKERPSVRDAHGKFLSARDMACSALLMVPLFLPGTAMIGGTRAACIVSGFLLVQYFLLVVVARNGGNRLVANALAEAATPK